VAVDEDFDPDAAVAGDVVLLPLQAVAEAASTTAAAVTPTAVIPGNFIKLIPSTGDFVCLNVMPVQIKRRTLRCSANGAVGAEPARCRKTCVVARWRVG
jgi:hypothetical protein